MMVRTSAWTLHSIMRMLLASVGLLLLAGAIYTVAFFSDDGSAHNYTTAAGYGAELIDVFRPGPIALPGDRISKTVSMRNSGEQNVVVRIRLTPSWEPQQDGNGVTLDPAAVSIAFGDSVATDWTLIDGWYYYNRILSPGDETSHLVESLSLGAVSNDDHGADYTQAEYTLNVEGESLQALTDATSVTWGVTFSAGPGNVVTWSGI